MNESVKTGTRPENLGISRDRSMAEILKDIIGNVQEIVRGEVRLAKQEAKTDAAKAWNSARILMMGWILALFAAGYVLLGIVYALALAIPAWAAAGCVGVVLAIAAAASISAGRHRWKLAHQAPEKTTETIKENIQWMKNRAR
jgi:uncharacterized membrane protein YqjE